MKKTRYPNRHRPPVGQRRPLGFVRCLECGMEFRSLTPHLKVHGMTAVQYRNKHGADAPTQCYEVHAAESRGGEWGNEIIRRRGFKHRTSRRFFRDPKWDEPGCAPRTRNETTDAGTAPVESGEPQAVHGAAVSAA